MTVDEACAVFIAAVNDATKIFKERVLNLDDYSQYDPAEIDALRKACPEVRTSDEPWPAPFDPDALARLLKLAEEIRGRPR
jgi:hypothetical protein